MRVNDVRPQFINDLLQDGDHPRIRHRRMERCLIPLVPTGQSSAGPAKYSSYPVSVRSLVKQCAWNVCCGDRYLVTATGQSLRERLNVLFHSAYKRVKKISDLQYLKYLAHVSSTPESTSGGRLYGRTTEAVGEWVLSCSRAVGSCRRVYLLTSRLSLMQILDQRAVGLNCPLP